MKRQLIRLEDIADRDHLGWAFWRAAQGKRNRRDVQAFAARFDQQINEMWRQLLDGTLNVGRTRSFWVRDPKRRLIHAPCFPDRVVHHALMAYVAPVFDRYLVPDTFACRVGKGTHAAVRRAQENSRRSPWSLKMDMRSYFASIDHQKLLLAIRRRIQGAGVIDLCEKIISQHESAPGRGLPIGALTSQHFANLYLASLDRYLLEEQKVRGLVRYMDDVVVWGPSRERLQEVASATDRFVEERLALQLKPSWQIQRTDRGLTLCGFRVYPHRLALTQRRKSRYRTARRRWELAYTAGHISAEQLQAGYASALAITAGADAVAWRRRELELRPPPDA